MMKKAIFYAVNLVILTACNSTSEYANPSEKTPEVIDNAETKKELSVYLKVEQFDEHNLRILLVEDNYERLVDELIDGFAEQINPDQFGQLDLPKNTISAVVLERSHHAPSEYFSLVNTDGKYTLIRGSYFGGIDWQEFVINPYLIGLWSSDTQKVMSLEFTGTRMMTDGLEGGSFYYLEGNKLHVDMLGNFYTINSITANQLTITDPYGDTWNMYKANPFD
jgi:hypothetical protein